MKRLIPIFSLAIFLLAAAPPAKKQTPANPPQPIYMEISTDLYLSAGQKEPPSQYEVDIYINGKNQRIDRYGLEGSEKLLMNQYIWKDGYCYVYDARLAVLNKAWSKEADAGGHGLEENLKYFSGTLGFKWKDYLKDMKALDYAKKSEVVKQENEKWNGDDYEVYKVISHYLIHNLWCGTRTPQ
jgi:hypothetical protein